MRPLFRRLIAAAAALITAALLPVGPAVAESNGGVRVMPLGDSITEGTQVPGGYRIGLWQRLAAGGYRVGLRRLAVQRSRLSSATTTTRATRAGASTRSTPTSSTWLRNTTPRTVLLHIGTNDVLQNYNVSGAPGRLSTLVDRITATAPNADVFVATIIPLANSGQEAAARTFNAAIPGIVQSKVNAGKRVHLVDMHAALDHGRPDRRRPPHRHRLRQDGRHLVHGAALRAGQHRRPGRLAGQADRRRGIGALPRRARLHDHQRHAGPAVGLPRPDQPVVDAELLEAAGRLRHQVPGRLRPRHDQRHPGGDLGLPRRHQPAVERQRQRHDHQRAVRPVPGRVQHAAPPTAPSWSCGPARASPTSSGRCARRDPPAGPGFADSHARVGGARFRSSEGIRVPACDPALSLPGLSLPGPVAVRPCRCLAVFAVRPCRCLAVSPSGAVATRPPRLPAAR